MKDEKNIYEEAEGATEQSQNKDGLGICPETSPSDIPEGNSPKSESCESGEGSSSATETRESSNGVCPESEARDGGEAAEEGAAGEGCTAEEKPEKYVWVKERYDGEKPKTFKGRLANFWFHYKWHTIVSVVVVLLISVIVTQFIGRTKYDITVIYAGGYRFSRLETDGAQSPYQTAFESLERVASDYDGNGETNVHLEDFYYLTDEEIAAYEAEGKTVNYQKLKEDRDNFHNTVKTGGACLLLLSSALYDELYFDSAFPDGGLFVDLSKLLSASGAEGYKYHGEGNRAVYLNSLKFSSLPIIEDLPDDTVVCLRIETEGFGGIGSNSKAYQNSVAMIKSLFAYGKKEN